MVRKNNCDHLLPSPAKHRPRIWLQPALLAVMSLIQNPVQSLGKMLEWNGCSESFGWWSVWAEAQQCSTAVGKSLEHIEQWSSASKQGASVPSWGQDIASSRISPCVCGCSHWDLKENGGNGQGRTTFPCLPALGLLSAEAPVFAEHLHRVTPLFPVMGDITETAGAWCSHLMFCK